MTELLNHQGFSGTIECDLGNNCLFGKVLFINDAVIYQGENLTELKQSFIASVDDYLETCKELGRSPDKPFSGSFNVRIDPALHKGLAIKAAEEGVSLNAVTAKAISAYLDGKARIETHIHNHNTIKYHFNFTKQDTRSPVMPNLVYLKSANQHG